MNKYLIVLVLLVFPLVSKADSAVYTFMNGQGFDPSYSTEVPRYAFLGDGNGWDYKLDKATTLMSVLGLDSTSTPSTITVTTGLPTADVCLNIEGAQTVVPEGMVTDGQGNCIVPVISAPSMNQSVGRVSQALPKLLANWYWSCAWGQSCQTQMDNYNGGPGQPNYSRFSSKGMSIASDEPTTAEFTFTPVQYVPATTTADGLFVARSWQSIGEDLTYSDNLSDTVHNVNYSDVPLSSGVVYITSFTLTNFSGGQTVISGFGPEYNIHVSF